MNDLQAIIDAVQATIDAVQALADAIVEAWEKSGLKEAFEKIAALAVEAEKAKPMERVRLRPHKNATQPGPD